MGKKKILTEACVFHVLQTSLNSPEYMLGDDLMVCPVVQEGARSRTIYFPKGSWMSPEGEVITGPSRVDNYPADLMVLPYFFRVLRQEGEIDSV